MNRLRRISLIVLVAFGLLLAPLFSSSPANAYTYKFGADATIDKIVNKNAHTAVGIFKDQVRLGSTIGNYIPEFLIGDNDCKKVPMPNTIIAGSEKSSPKLTCKEFLTGKGSSWNGIVGDAKKIKIESGITNQQTTADAIKSYGYSRMSAAPFTGTEQRCMRAHIKDHTRTNSDKSIYEKDTDNKICALVDNSDGLVLSVSVDSDNTNNSWEYWFVEEGEYKPFASSAYGKTFNLNYTGNWSMFSGGITVTFDNMPTWSEFVGEWEQRAKDKNGGYASCDENHGSTASCVTIVADQGSGGGVEDEEMTWDTTYKKGTSAMVVEALLGYPYAKSLSTAEVYNIYNQYLNNTSYVEMSCDADYNYSSDTLYKWMHVLVKREDKIDDTCWAREKQEVLYTGATAVSGSYDPQTGKLTSGGYYFTREDMSLQAIIDQINSFDLEAILNDIDDVNDPASPPSSSDGSGEEVEPTCANSGGAESLGWIVCPILEWMRNAATDVYEDALKPALEVETKLFSDGGGTEKAWSYFRNIANILFIVLFLVVIFSQLTGVGIDNYGIKKILPKLVVVAILINLSYLLCIICVDLSNILGNSLQALFDGLPTGSPDPSVSEAVGSAGATTISAVVLLAGLGGGALVAWKNPAILISLLVGALGVVIAIFFVFILLAAREAAIVVLTVISPLAIACYMLPNTKRMFDKWLKFWEGLLFLYPICGALIGGGNFVSNLLLSAGIATQGFWSALTAMIVGIIPIFFIPTALRGAFAAMGAIGSKITGFGDRMRGGATRGIRNSESYKNIRERGQETGIRRRAGYDKDGNRIWGENGPSRFQRLVRGGRRNIQRNTLAYQKLRSEKGSLDATDGSDYMLATETANEAKRIVSSGEINNAGRVGVSGSLTDGLYRALMSNDRAKIQAYTDALSGKGEDGRVAVKSAYNQAVGAGMSEVAAQTFANNILANHGADYKNNNRSMFEVAKNINQGEQATSTDNHLSNADNRAKLAGKVTASTIGNMDDDAFGEIFGGYNGDVVSIPKGADTKEIGAAAYAALNTQNANIKAERRSYLEKIVKASGYTPESQNVNVTKMPPSVNAQEGQVLNVRALSDDTLLDIATNPNSADNDPNRMAAEVEWRRRNPDE